MSDVWVVRNADGDWLSFARSRLDAILTADFGRDQQAFEELRVFGNNGPYGGFTITRETLLTPAHAAVIAAASRVTELYDSVTVSDGVTMPHTPLAHQQLTDAHRTLLIAVRALRATTPTEPTP